MKQMTEDDLEIELLAQEFEASYPNYFRLREPVNPGPKLGRLEDPYKLFIEDLK